MKHLKESLAHARALLARTTEDFFISYSWSTHTPRTERCTTFYTSLILAACQTSDSVCSESFRIHAQRVWKQRSDAYSFNYWKRGTNEQVQFPYPDDLDDTFVALCAVHTWTPEAIDVHAFAGIIELLTTYEVSEGGPYNTWCIPEFSHSVWEDIDIAVNSNIARFLAYHDIELPSIVKLIEDAILKKAYTSKYYHNGIAIMYFIAGWYTGTLKDMLIEHIQESLTNTSIAQSPLSCALCTAALLRLGAPATSIESHIQFLCTSLKRPIPLEAFFIEQKNEDETLYSGCIEWTIALIGETLERYLKQTTVAVSTETDSLLSAITIAALEQFSSCDISLRETAKVLINRLIQKNESGEIPLLADRFNNSLSNPLPQTLSIRLGVINVLGWIGYTIFDDLLDGHDKTAYIPFATICVRRVSTMLYNLVAQHHHPYIEHILDRIEDAHQWEYHHTRIQNGSIPPILPNYSDFTVLAEKSLGHALGPIVLTLTATDTTADAELLERFFKHYLIARQLNDDAHDWYEDYLHGYLNGVCAPMIALWRALYKEEPALETLRSFFWNEYIEVVAAEITSHCAEARALIQTMSFLRDTTVLTTLLSSIETAANKALSEKAKTLSFIEEYAH